MNRYSLFTRTFILIALSLSILSLLLSYFYLENKKKSLIDVLYSKSKTIARSITLVASDAIITSDYSFIVEQNTKVINNNPGLLYLIVTKINDTANIVSTKKHWEMLDKLPKEITALQKDKEQAKIFKSSIIKDKEVYNYAYPINFNGIKWGWVIIGHSMQEYENAMQKAYITALLLLVGTILLSLVFSYFLTSWLVTPIISLKNAAQKVAAGDLNAKVDITSKDEIGTLAKSFNEMVDTIKESNEKLHSYNEELEKRVEQRTQELNVLNQNLDKRVKEEVQKRAKQEQMLIQQSRFAAMGEMIGNIAHQWRQPLNALSLLLQNIENAYEMDMLDEAYIKRSVAKGNRLTKAMSQTIDDFRNFFRPNKQAEIFSVHSALNATMDMVKSSFENHMINFEQHIDDSLCVRGFSSEFSQVILNILTNAKDALIENKKEARKITIIVSKDENNDNNVIISIEDNAGGIPQDIIQNIFDPYFTTKEEGKGTGIGLYMSKTIVETNMRGRLSVLNTADGAKFIIELKRETC